MYIYAHTKDAGQVKGRLQASGEIFTIELDVQRLSTELNLQVGIRQDPYVLFTFITKEQAVTLRDALCESLPRKVVDVEALHKFAEAAADLLRADDGLSMTNAWGWTNTLRLAGFAYAAGMDIGEDLRRAVRERLPVAEAEEVEA